MDNNVSNNTTEMNDEVFWLLFNEAETHCGDDYDKRKNFIIESLSRFSSADIIKFQKIYQAYHEKAYTNKMRDAATKLSERGTPDNVGFSMDGFDYFRCWLIGQGKEVYMAAIENPYSILSMDLKPHKYKCGYIGFDWEVYFAYYAYEKVTGRCIYDDMETADDEQL